VATIALAIRNQEFQQGRIFDLDAIDAMRDSLRPIAVPWVTVAAEARRRGLRLVTADQVGDDASEVRVLAYDWPPVAAELVAHGARAVVLTTLEPPVIAWSFYADLARLSAGVAHALVFRGAQARLAPGCTFNELRYPQAPRPASSPPDWGGRTGFLAMINSNKAIVRSPMRAFDRPRELSLKRELAAWRYRPIGRELYSERLRAIRWFARSSDFDLYGEGWERRHPQVDRATHAHALRAYRGTTSDKLATLGSYRFALAFENARFDGYVSEKLFDCLYAGAIPVYLGAPDIDRFVPPDAFVDARRFPSYAALEAHLRVLSSSQADSHLAAARAFLASPAFQSFSAERFAEQVLDLCVRASDAYWL
jgi:hypothetical protein